MSPASAKDTDGSANAVSPRRSHSRSWKCLIAIVLIGSLGWVCWSLSSAWPVLMGRRSEISMSWLSTGILLALIASLLLCLAFARLTALFEPSRLRLLEMGHLYFTAQLLKHVPGRIWGIGYQWTLGRDFFTLSTWVWANILHMILAMYFSIWFAVIVMTADHSVRGCIGVLLLGILAYFFIWNMVSIVGNWKWISSLGARHAWFKAGFPPALTKANAPLQARIFILLFTSWVLYFLSWYASGQAYASLGGWNGVRMCAYYLVAWFVGYVTLISPSGLGVRELVFVWLAKDYAPDAVALMAIVGRVNSLLVDILLGLVFAPFAPIRNSMQR